MENEFYSPLMFPVRLDDEKILVLDETQLPQKETYIEVKNLEEALACLQEMKTRAFGQVLLFFYACVLFEELDVFAIAQAFSQSRPTFDFAFLAQIFSAQAKKTASRKKAAESFILGFDNLRRKRAERLASILPNPAKILTICNVNGEMIYLYQALKKQQKEAVFYVSETRPYLQGTRLTFWELRRNNIPAYLICDNQAALLMYEKKVNCVVTGADRASKKGGIVNKIGTYALAVLAQHFQIPFYPLTQYPRDLEIEAIEIEERPQQEAFMFLNQNYAAEAVYPAFDVVKKDLITQAIELLPEEYENKRA